MFLEMDTPVQFLKGVGPARAEMFRKAGIRSVEDLLSWIPFRYEDREEFLDIASLEEGDRGVISGLIAAAGKRAVRRKAFHLFETIVSDGRGSISLKFFNQPYLSGVLREGRRAVFFGEVTWDRFSRCLTMLNPEIEFLEEGGDLPIHSGRIVPVYRRIDRISGRQIRGMVSGVLENLGDIPELLPEEIRRKYGFPGIKEAFRDIHFPSLDPGKERKLFLEELETWDTPSQRRMIYGEFFLFQAGLRQARMEFRRAAGNRQVRLSDQLRERIRGILPFRPTAAQKKALLEIVQDLVSPGRMNRLLQGDVGSGKTIVALQAMIVMMENGYQAAYMAPTELLAEQHFRTFSELLAGTPFRTGFLSSSTRGAERRQVLAGLVSGRINLVVGTHSLIQEKVSFKTLGLAVIDEQHRFGVRQRTVLAEKGQEPDILVMTATPIPRSLAMTLYGDLDISVIDRMPEGRKPVKTIRKSEKSREDVYALVRERLRQGQQAFIVYPLVEESEKTDLGAAVEQFEFLRERFLPFRVGLLHGKMNADEKNRIMREFRDGGVQLLVTTTVVEVGIDVPAATLMIIEHAERFGLAQLHQLRGRVGRGGLPGLCILMTSAPLSGEAGERLRVMCRSHDGFVIAEKDLEIRGPGDYLGIRQAGIPDFHFGNLVRHGDLLAKARDDVAELFESGGLSRDERERLRESCRGKWSEIAGFFN